MQSVTRHDSEHPTIRGHGAQPGNRYPRKAPSLVTKRVQPSEIRRHQTADQRPHHSHRSSREAQDNQHPPLQLYSKSRTVRGSSLLSSSCCHMALRGHLSSDRRGETMPAHSSQQNKGELRTKPPLPNSGTVSAAATCIPCPCSDSCATSSQRMLSEGHMVCLAFAVTGRVCADDDDHVATRSSGSSCRRVQMG